MRPSLVTTISVVLLASFPTRSSADGLASTLAGIFLHGVKKSDKIEASNAKVEEECEAGNNTAEKGGGGREATEKQDGDDDDEFWAQFHREVTPKDEKPIYNEDGELVVVNRRTGRRGTIGVSQRVDGTDEEREKALLNMKMSIIYLRDHVLAYGDDRSGNACKNSHELCAFWASTNECTRNWPWMAREGNCALACMQCEVLVDPARSDAEGEDLQIQIDDLVILGTKKNDEVGILGTKK